jgi:DNA-binding LacI/PurR family transcriptional regulator
MNRQLRLFPAIAKAYAFVKGQVESSAWYQGEYLPSQHSLAKSAGVSRTSMIKALERAKAEGLLHSIEHHRLRMGPPVVDNAGDTGTLTGWQAKRRLLEHDIMSGELGTNGTLPIMKELQTRYGVCYRTVQKILRALESDGIVKPLGKKFVIPGVPPDARRYRIVIIIFKDYFEQESALNHKNSKILNLFENECVRLGMRLEIIKIDFFDSADISRTILKLTKDNLTLGYILDSGWYEADMFHRSVASLLARLAFLEKPVAILDDAGAFDVPKQFTTNRLFQVYRIQGSRAGERIAGYLLGLGHRRVAYLSMLHFTSWSRQRFEGIKTQFSRSGFHADNVHLVADSTDFFFPAILEAAGFNETDVFRLLAAGETQPHLADWKKKWAEYRKKPVTLPDFMRFTGRELTYLKEAIALNRSEKAGFFADRNYAGMHEAIGERLVQMSLIPLFGKAEKLGDVTAWICANDTMALHAITYLQDHGFRVPQDISVVGFDNEPVHALERRLTTFDFNALEFIRQMLNFIVRPLKPRGPFQHRPIEVEGIVMLRDTTGKIR